MSKRAVQAILDQVAQDIGRLDALGMRELAPLLAQAERETAKALAAWLARAPGAGERFTAFQLRRVLLQLREALDTIRHLEPALYATLQRHSSAAVVLASRHVQDELATFSSMFGGSLNGLRIDLAAITARGDRMLIPRFRTSAERYAGQVGRDIKHQLTIGMLRNETMEQMTTRLRSLGGPKGRVFLRGAAGDAGAISEQISEGLFARYYSWANRVVRTETINTYNVHADQSIREAAISTGEPLMRAWNAAADRRVCDLCRGLDGQVTSLDRPFVGGYDRPPAHPYCRCSVVAWHREWSRDFLP